MKVVKNIQKDSFEIKSDDLIDIKFSNHHPELMLADNSVLIFDSIETYYQFIGNAEVYNPESVDIEAMFNRYETYTDTVSEEFEYDGEKVNVASLINYYDGGYKGLLVYLQRNGINPIK